MLTTQNHPEPAGGSAPQFSRAAGGPGLRDPWSARCGGGGGSPAAPAAPLPTVVEQTPDAGRLLSPELEGLLLDRLEKADAINAAYIACRADAVNLRATLQPTE